MFIIILFIQTSAIAGDCGENCFERDLDTDGVKEKIHLVPTEPSTIEVKIVGKTSLPITHTADLQGNYQLSVADRDNDGDFDLMVNWVEKGSGMDRTKILQNNGKGDFKDVTNSEK